MCTCIRMCMYVALTNKIQLCLVKKNKNKKKKKKKNKNEKYVGLGMSLENSFVLYNHVVL